uniref:Uncharacterized protein n=1 Tax=Oryza punctata TaxID=4537 RepID=A0A0E0MFF4_ORYPU
MKAPRRWRRGIGKLPVREGTISRFLLRLLVTSSGTLRNFLRPVRVGSRLGCFRCYFAFIICMLNDGLQKSSKLVGKGEIKNSMRQELSHIRKRSELAEFNHAPMNKIKRIKASLLEYLQVNRASQSKELERPMRYCCMPIDISVASDFRICSLREHIYRSMNV